MTYLNTQHTLQFIQRNDQNGNGLSKNELMQGAMKSCMQMMECMSTGNQQGMMEAFQNLATASQLAQGFDVMSQASGQIMPDNPNTISCFDVMKTAMNDGNMGNISNYDMASQYQQNQTNNSWGVFNFGNSQGCQQQNGVMVGGQMFPDLSNWNTQQQQPLNYNNSSFFSGGVSNYSQVQESNGFSGQGALGGILAGGALALATGGAALPLMGIGALVGSGVAGNALEGLGGLTQSLGQGIQGFGDLIEMPFNKVGEFLGKIPVVGGLLEGATKLTGKLTALPTKLLGKGVELGGKIVSGIGKAVNKVGSFLKKL